MLTNILKFKSAKLAKITGNIIVLLMMFLSVFNPVNAQGTSGGGSASLSQINPGTTVDIRNNYFKRFPFAKAAHDADTLTNTPPVASTGTGSPPATMPMTIRAYDSCIKPIGYYTACYAVPMILPMPMLPGHFLLGACANHMPQYTNPQEYPGYLQPFPMYVQATLPTARDNEVFQNQLTTFGIPMSDTQFQLIDRENKQRFLELLFDPERWMWMYTAASQLMFTSASNTFAGMAGTQFQATANAIVYGTSNPSSAGSGGSGTGGAAGGAAGAIGGAAGGLPQSLMPNPGALINIANENAASPTYSNNPNKTVSQAIYMVQKLYKLVFVPMAVLFLLPGAVLTQMKVVISQGFKFQADDVTSPFEGIIRVMIAVFLIPATQLIVSYSIDIGNSMAYTVAQWVDINNTILPWANEMTYNVSNANNALVPQNSSSSSGGGAGGALSGAIGGGGGSGGGGSSGFGGFLSGLVSSASSSISSWLSSIAPSWAQSMFSWLSGSSGVSSAGGTGVAAGQLKQQSVVENTSYLSAMMQLIFNVLEWFFSQMLLILGAFQLVYMCYLFLLGPISAAFYAWPTIQSSSGVLFRNVFSGWVTAVITVALWRFYWMVILAIMSVYAADQQGVSNIDIQWDIVVFVCFLGLMMVVPFNPFSFDPGQTAEGALSYGAEVMQTFSGALKQEAQGTALAPQIDKLAAQMSNTASAVGQVGSTMWQGSMFDPQAGPMSAGQQLAAGQGGSPIAGGGQGGSPPAGGAGQGGSPPAGSGQGGSPMGGAPPSTPPPPPA